MSTIAAAPSAGVYARPATVLEPVAPGERIQALDLLRGWAMFGVLWSNLNDWYGTADETTAFDRALGFAQQYLVESRFYTLLCLLFGIGFGIQLTRASARGTSIQHTYLRRSAALLAIGLVHALLIWHGDILVMYALVSFALLLFRDASPKRLLASALVVYLLAFDIVNRLRWLAGQRYMVPRAPRRTASWIYGHGTIAQISHQRVLDVADWYGRWGLTTYFAVLAMFLAGAWALKSGYFERVIRDRRATRRLLAWSLAAAVIGQAGTMALGYYLSHSTPPRPTTLGFFLNFWHVAFVLLDPTIPMGLVYAALLLLVFQTARGPRWLAPLAATGRMALTTYLTQSVVCTFLFYSFGLRLFGRVGYTGMFTITLVLFALQMLASTWWLRRYRFGPVEWVWRTLTYGHRPPLKVATAASAG